MSLSASFSQKSSRSKSPSSIYSRSTTHTPSRKASQSSSSHPVPSGRGSADNFSREAPETQSAYTNPFQTPGGSIHASSLSLTDATATFAPAYFHSRRVRKEEIVKPWLEHARDRRAKWQTIIPLIGMGLGLCLGAYMVYSGWTSVPEHRYCPVYEQDFSLNSTLDPKIWTKEAEVGGFGNGQFEETTTTDENVYIADGMLTIKPTLQDEQLVTTNNVINLTRLGTCSSNVWSNCVASTNTTNGTIVPPVKSGRISTKRGPSIKYGRVEVVAKMPAGDWLWPAIWMLPVNNTYGEWPLSGEIDIIESRGNNHTYPLGGNNYMSSTLHWGPDLTNDAWWRTYGKQAAPHTTFAQSFHTFGLEWSEKYIYMYLDSRLLQVMYNKFNGPLWKRGAFPLSDRNGTAYVDPWTTTNDDSAPFNKNFYLILNVAVGGTNGWFEDGVAGKPWVDSSPTARRDFWLAQNTWLPTWTDPTMKVKSIKMWQQAGYNGC